MLISSALVSLGQTNPLSNAAPVNKQAQSVADAIAQANESAAAKRKSMAEEKLKMLGERLRVLMLLSATDRNGNRGYAKSAAYIAKEIAQAAQEYAGESGSGTDSAAAGAQGLSKQDQAFLAMADQLSSQVKSIIASENQKARRKHLPEDSYQGVINEMDDAINQAAKSLGQSVTPPSFYSMNISISSFSFVA